MSVELGRGEDTHRKNLFVRAVENNQTLKWSGALVAFGSLFDILAKGNLLSEQDHVKVIIIGVLGVIGAAIGEGSKNAENVK
nr:hypothetical protein [Candidatus Levybacteria bacterium]